MTVLHLVTNQPARDRDAVIAGLKEELHTEKLLHLDTQMKLLALQQAMAATAEYHAKVLGMIARSYE